jgi:hypothetical protein
LMCIQAKARETAPGRIGVSRKGLVLRATPAAGLRQTGCGS